MIPALRLQHTARSNTSSFIVKLEMINVYSADFKKIYKINKASWGNKCLVEEKCKNGEGSSLGVIRLHLENREAKLNQQGEVCNNTS